MSRTAILLTIAAAATAAQAQLQPEWLTRFAPSEGINAGPAGMLLDPSGRMYMAGRVGNIYVNLDALVWRVNSDGTTAYARLWDSPGQTHDQGHAFALAPDGTIILVGATIGQNLYSAGLILALDPGTGAERWHRTYDPTELGGESFDAVAVDAQGNIFIAGTVFGDGTDALLAKYSPTGELLWDESWDGPPEAPYSLDSFRRVLIDPAGDPVVVGYGITGERDLLEDFLVERHASADGALVWRQTYGGPGRDLPTAGVMDAAGDIYITGDDHVSGTSGRRAVTIKYSNAGAVRWSVLDQGGAADVGTSLVLTPAGAVVTGIASDPDFNVSNFNENWYLVAHDQQGGGQSWTFRFGANCVSCYDVPQHFAATSDGRLYAAGKTNSAPYANDIILFEFDAATGAELRRGTIDPGPTSTGSVLALALDASERLYLSGSVNDPDLRFLAARYGTGGAPACYANCDGSTAAPLLNVLDFNCFLNRFSAGEPYANCDGSTEPPALNVLDFNCFLNRFIAGCP